MESYYYHRFRNFNLNTLFKVIESGFILPRKMIVNGVSDANNIFNGNSYISLAQKTLMTDDMYKHFRSSYNELIQGSLCAVISPEIEGIVYPNYFDCEYGTSFIISDDSTERYSYYLDEIQTAVPIPTSKFLAIGYPMTHFKTKKNSEEIIEEIITIERELKNHGIEIPIIDSTRNDFADDEEQIQLSKIRILKSKIIV